MDSEIRITQHTIRKVKIVTDVGFFYCPYIPKAFMTVNRDADPPPLDADEWGIAHGVDFPIDLEWDPTGEPWPETDTRTPEERAVDAYDRAKRAIERM